jgi:hypothetical protein
MKPFLRILVGALVGAGFLAFTGGVSYAVAMGAAHLSGLNPQDYGFIETLFGGLLILILGPLLVIGIIGLLHDIGKNFVK